jgi:hypothetical protein
LRLQTSSIRQLRYRHVEPILYRDLRACHRVKLERHLRSGLMVLLNEPMWMIRPARSSDASAGTARPASCSSLELVRTAEREPFDQPDVVAKRQFTEAPELLDGDVSERAGQAACH